MKRIVTPSLSAEDAPATATEHLESISKILIGLVACGQPSVILQGVDTLIVLSSFESFDQVHIGGACQCFGGPRQAKRFKGAFVAHSKDADKVMIDQHIERLPYLLATKACAFFDSVVCNQCNIRVALADRQQE